MEMGKGERERRELVIKKLNAENRRAKSIAREIIKGMRKIHVDNGDVLFFRMADPIDMRIAEVIADDFREQGKKVLVIVAPDSLVTERALEKISEEKMREYGWVRNVRLG
jgi:radical SAM superfamily enzyme YgiQ (UPF0313 family)